MNARKKRRSSITAGITGTSLAAEEAEAKKKDEESKQAKPPLKADNVSEGKEGQKEKMARRKSKRGSVSNFVLGLVGKGLDEGGDNKKKGRRRSSIGFRRKPEKKAEHSSTAKYRKQKIIEWSTSTPHINLYSQLKAMIVKRFLVSKRNRKAVLMEGVLPVLGVLMGVLFFTLSHQTVGRDFDPIVVEPDNYAGANLRWLYSDVANGEFARNPFEKYGEELLGGSISVAKVTKFGTKDDFFFSGSNCDRYDGIYDAQCAAFSSNDPVLLELKSSGLYSNKTTLSEGGPWELNELFYNGSNTWAVPLAANVLAESVLADKLDAMGASVNLEDRRIHVSYQGFPRNAEELEKVIIPSGIEVGVCVVIFVTFASITASHCTDSVAERETGCKRQQLVSGVNPIIYWFANFLFDFSFFLCVPFAMINLILQGFSVPPFHNQPGETATLLLFFGMASVPFSYACSFGFAKSGTAQVMMITLNTVMALIVIFVVLFMESLELTALATPVRFVGMLVPHVSLGMSFWTFINEGTLDVDDGTLSGDGMMALYLLLFEFFIFFTLVIAMENSQDAASRGYARSKEGTIDEAAADKCRPTSRNAQNLRTISEDDLFTNIINILIMINLVTVFIELGTDGELDETEENFLASIQLFFSLVFIAEFMVKVGGFGPIGYLKDPFNIFDGLLVLVSIIDLVMMGSSDVKEVKQVKMFKLFKVLRMMRMLRFIRFLKTAKYEAKQSSSNNLSKEQEELMNKKSSGRRDSLVKRLSILGGESVEGSAVHTERRRISRRLTLRADERRRSSATQSMGSFIAAMNGESAESNENDNEDLELERALVGGKDDAVVLPGFSGHCAVSSPPVATIIVTSAAPGKTSHANRAPWTIRAHVIALLLELRSQPQHGALKLSAHKIQKHGIHAGQESAAATAACGLQKWPQRV